MAEQEQNQACLFTKYAEGQIDESYFEIKNVDHPSAELESDQVLLKLTFISVDPYMRGRMNSRKNYFDNFSIGQPYSGGVVGQVLKSSSEKFKEGDNVVGFLPWVKYQVASAKGLQILPPNIRASYFLGMLGMPGQSAYVPLHEIGQIKAGQTVFISGAAGAVGATAGQVCKAVGCKVIGSAGSADKVEYLKQIGFDEVINYKTDNIGQKLQEFSPEGYDVYFDNVGGETLDIALENMKTFGVVIACGQISNYDTKPEERYGNKNLFYIITKRIKMQGFLIFDFQDKLAQATKDLIQYYSEGKLQVKETVVNGFENIPKAFLGLFKGDNTGKMVVEL